MADQRTDVGLIYSLADELNKVNGIYWIAVGQLMLPRLFSTVFNLVNVSFKINLAVENTIKHTLATVTALLQTKEYLL